MRKIVSTLTAILFTALLSTGQTIPNGDFENWKTWKSPYIEPTGWVDGDSVVVTEINDSLSSLYSFFLKTKYTPSVTRTTGYNSNYAVKLTNTTNTYTYDIPGIIDSSVTDTVPGVIGIRFASDSTPAALSGYYKFSETAGVTDTASMEILFTRWNTTYNVPDSLGGGFIYFTITDTGFTPFSIPISYLNGASPDTISIAIASASIIKNNNVFIPGTTLIVDQLSFGGQVITAITSAQTLGAVTAYPNPAADIINFSNLPTSAANVQISDVTGRQVAQATLPGSVDVSGLKQGVYIYSITDNGGNTIGTSRFVK